METAAPTSSSFSRPPIEFGGDAFRPERPHRSVTVRRAGPGEACGVLTSRFSGIACGGRAQYVVTADGERTAACCLCLEQACSRLA